MTQTPISDRIPDPETMVGEYLPLVRSIAKKYARYGLALEDLVQEGMLGLLEAVKHYQPDQNTQFSTYATFWIKKYILSALNAEARHLQEYSSIDEHKLEAIQPVSNDHDLDSVAASGRLKLSSDLPEIEQHIIRLSYQHKLPLKTIAKRLDLSPEKVRQLRQKALRRLQKHVITGLSIPDGRLLP